MNVRDALKLVPTEWTDAADVGVRISREFGPGSAVLADLERGGKVETQVSGNPPRVQVRRVQPTKVL